MSVRNGKSISTEKLNELVELLTSEDLDLAQEYGEKNRSEAITVLLLLGSAANTLASPSSLDSVRNLRGKDLILFVRELIQASQVMLHACEAVQSFFPSAVPETLVMNLNSSLQSLEEKIGGTQTEINELEKSISEVVEDNKVAEEQLLQRMKEVDILFENNSQLKSLLDVYANVNVYVARSLPGRFHTLTTKLNHIEQELQEVDAGLRSAIEEHQQNRLLWAREA